jgi:hypothetical protein
MLMFIPYTECSVVNQITRKHTVYWIGKYCIIELNEGAERVYRRHYWRQIGGQFFSSTDWNKKS